MKSPPNEGRIVIFEVLDENGDINEIIEENKFMFKGTRVTELKQTLKEKTGIIDIIVCSRSPFNNRLYPLKLHLPPNNADMSVVVVPANSAGKPKFGKFNLFIFHDFG